MKLSILDQAPVSSGKTAKEALEASASLAQTGEKYGYTRYWIAEHHDIAGLACSAPEVMLGYIGSKTSVIRIGTGAVLLPHYQPYKVAEIHNMLETLFPGRIDIGIGRSPGGSAEASMALSENFLAKVNRFPETVSELLKFLKQGFPEQHLFSKVSASPTPNTPPKPWILGTSKKSALLAAKKGIGYSFAHFMSDRDGPEIVETYRNQFKQNSLLDRPESIVAVSVICAETKEEAEQLALSSLLWGLRSAKGEKINEIPSLTETQTHTFSEQDEKMIKEMRSKMIIGDPKEVKQQLSELQEIYQCDEMMILTIIHDYEKRNESYRLLAKEVFSRG